MDRIETPATLSDRVRAAARDAGILPDDPLESVVEAIGSVPDEISLRVNPLLAQIKTFTARAEQAANRPLLTDGQLRDYALPAVLNAFWWGWAILLALLLIAAYWLGGAVHDWREVPLQCGAHWDDGRPFCYRPDPNGEFLVPPAPATPAAPAAAPATPAPDAKPATGKKK
jgi:hypothetical protein